MGTQNSDGHVETRRRSVLAAAAGGLTAGAIGTGVGTGTAAAADHGEVTIVHDSHFHGRFQDSGDPEKNIARYHAMASELLDGHDNAAFLGNGDDLAPSVLGLEYEGEQMVDALNYMGPDAVGAGNHEFDFGVDVAEQRFQESEFPWTVANLLTPEGEPIPGTERWTTIEVGDVTLGVFGLVVNGFHSITDYPDDYQVLDNVEAAAEATKALKADEGADFVVCAAHVSTGKQEEVAEAVDDLDAIVGSHSGVTFEEPKEVAGTVISEFGDEFDHLGRLTFDAESGDLLEWERIDFYNSAELDEDESPPGTDHDDHRPVDVQELAPDAGLQELIDGYLDELEERLGEPVVESEVELNASFDNYAVETGFGNLLTDIMRTVGDLDEEIDVAVQNAGGIRSGATYGPGEITGRDVMNILPFPNEIEVYELTGEQLHSYLEGAVRPLPSGYGAQPAIQVSGVSYEWTGHFGEGEIENVFVDGEPLEADETYLVSTNDYVAGNSEAFQHDSLVLHSGQLQGPYVMDVLDTEYDTVAPTREHRMIRVDEDLGDASVAPGEPTEITVEANDAIVAPVEGTFRVVAATGDVVEADAVSQDGAEITAAFDTDELATLASDLEEPGLRLFGEFEPDNEHYGYENDDGEIVELPASSGYDNLKLKGAIDASSLARDDEGASEADDDESEGHSHEDDGHTHEDEDHAHDGGDDDSAASAPGFGAATGAAGTAGGAYLYSKYGSGDDSRENE